VLNLHSHVFNSSRHACAVDALDELATAKERKKKKPGNKVEENKSQAKYLYTTPTFRDLNVRREG
jgi:hypothetical protein